MALNFDVIVIGSYSIDYIFSGLDEFPALGKDVLSTSFTVTPGEAFISAVSMHRLGLKVGWAADFGNDEYSCLALKHARDEGLDESLFVMHDRPFRRISVAASMSHDRGFLTYYDPEPKIPAAIPALLKSHAKVMLIPGLVYGSLLETGINLVHSKKMKIFMDGNSTYGDIIGKTGKCLAIRKAIKNIDVFLPNAQEARRLTGELDLHSAIRQLEKLCPCVVIKDGPCGSIASFKGTLYHAPGIPINSIETTGAGDNFNAGFLKAWVDGQPIMTCLEWGNIAGGLSTTEAGGTTYKISVQKIEELHSKYYPGSE